MTKEDLRTAFALMDELNKVVDDFAKLGLDFVETPFFNVPGSLFDLLISSNFDEEGQDTVNWWYFEKQACPGLKMTDSEGVELCETFDDLWDYVSKHLRY